MSLWRERLINSLGDRHARSLLFGQEDRTIVAGGRRASGARRLTVI